MKEIIGLFLIVTSIVVLLAACTSKNNNETISFSIDSNGNYTGFSNLPSNYLLHDAEKDGCYVMQDSEPISNNEVWDNFIETAVKGNNIGIRMVNFYIDDSNSPYCIDLFFNDGFYYLFDDSSDNQEKQPFKYLLSLEGRSGIPLKNSGAVVLTDDKTLTFDVVMKSLYSSSIGYIQSGSPFRLVMSQH